MQKEILGFLLKEASDMEVTRRDGRVVDVQHTPEGRENTRKWRQKLYGGLGGAAGAAGGYGIASKLSDSPITTGLGAIGGLTAGTIGGIAGANKTMDKALEKERKKNLRYYKRRLKK